MSLVIIPTVCREMSQNKLGGLELDKGVLIVPSGKLYMV